MDQCNSNQCNSVITVLKWPDILPAEQAWSSLPRESIATGLNTVAIEVL